MKNGYAIYWEGVKKELEGFHSQTEYAMFIDRIQFAGFDEEHNVMELYVPSNFIKDHIIKYQDDFEDTLTKIYGNTCKIEFTVKGVVQESESESEPEVEPQQEATVTVEQPVKQPIQEPVIKPMRQTQSSPKQDDYTFESFIIGNSNEFAAKAARAVAENPGTQYNPYFVWGDSGLGKTHLLKSIEKYVRDYFPAKKVKYVTAEEFTNDFVNSLSTRKMEQFRIKYRQLDVLIVDDVQFFANKEGIQGELFNTFNKLYDDFKQMIFSCDQPIKKVKKMEDRLKSRFSMGLVVDLRPPDFELRMAILKHMAYKHKFDIDFDAMEYICSNIVGNIRELKGAFQILQAYSSIMKKTISLSIVKEQLKEKLSGAHSSPISVDKIIQFVAEYYNLKAHEIIGVKRIKSIALARQIAMYISRKITRLSTTQIGKYFGNREHGTVMHATKKIEDLINKDSKMKRDVELIIDKLQAES